MLCCEFRTRALLRKEISSLRKTINLILIFVVVPSLIECVSHLLIVNTKIANILNVIKIKKSE